MESVEEDHTISISGAALGLVSAISTKAMQGEFYSRLGVVNLKTNIKEKDLPVEDIEALKEGLKWVTKFVSYERTIGEITKVDFEVVDGMHRVALTFTARPIRSFIPISSPSSISSISSLHRVQNTVIRKKKNDKGKKNKEKDLKVLTQKN